MAKFQRCALGDLRKLDLPPDVSADDPVAALLRKQQKHPGPNSMMVYIPADVAKKVKGALPEVFDIASASEQAAARRAQAERERARKRTGREQSDEGLKRPA